MNRLATATSPYLLQHARNPVDWYPWGEEAIAAARNADKPIFLSVGYSTCHWCHVMAHESFENAEVADVLNSHFVAIKVDREERPDIDRLYMTALQAMGQNGGWPMSMFLTPDLKPFYGGTYFPPESRFGRIGFKDLLDRIHGLWTTERSNIDKSAGEIVRFLEDAVVPRVEQEGISWDVVEKCFRQFRDSFDDVHAGFGNGSKFPRPVALQFLLLTHYFMGEREGLDMVERTLVAMAEGGIRDHLGGGFHRYTVDNEWRVPHFEKMLYDQAQLVEVYLEAFQVSGRDVYHEVARRTCDYVLGELRSPQGTFFSAEDADSPLPGEPGEHGEGAFYLWTKQEVVHLLGKEEGFLFAAAYGIEEEGNASVDPQHEFTGKNILYMAETIEALSIATGRSLEDVATSLAQSRIKLLERRHTRPRPFRDEKVVLSWNGLMIAALAKASSVLRHPEYFQAARNAAGAILEIMRDPSTGLLMRRMSGDEVSIDGQLVDYAFLVSGLIALYEASGEARWLEEAVALTEVMVRLFHDERGGGFFETDGMDHSVLVRQKELYDGAEPSGNAVAAVNLMRLAVFTGREEWRALAERAMLSVSGLLVRQPVAMPAMASAIALFLKSSLEVVIAGTIETQPPDGLLREFYRRYLPSSILVLLGSSEVPSVLHPLLRSLRALDTKSTAYVCKDYACSLPTSDPAEFATLLDTGFSARGAAQPGE